MAWKLAEWFTSSLNSMKAVQSSGQLESWSSKQPMDQMAWKLAKGFTEAYRYSCKPDLTNPSADCFDTESDLRWRCLGLPCETNKPRDLQVGCLRKFEIRSCKCKNTFVQLVPWSPQLTQKKPAILCTHERISNFH